MKGKIYLTIDDGPFEDIQTKLDILKVYDIKAIFYFEGRYLKEREKEVIAAIKDGHIIGNHGHTHTRFSKLSLTEGKEEILKCDEIINDLYKKANVLRTLKTFRFPYFDMGLEGSDNFFDRSDPKTSALNRYLMELGYEQPAFEGEPANILSERSLDQSIGVSATLDTRDWSIGQKLNENTLVDGPYLLKQFEESLRLCEFKNYHIVICHTFTPDRLFRQFIERILEYNQDFALPESGEAPYQRAIMRRDEHHMDKHKRIMENNQKDACEIILLGDSITRRWEDYNTAFETYFSPWHTVNYGIGGDMLENVIWRIHGGELDHMRPKIITLLIGTNNLEITTDDVIIEGIRYVVHLIEEKCPDTKIILHGIFPRHGNQVCSDFNTRIDFINSEIERLIQSEKVIYVNLKEDLLQGEKQVSEKIMPDGLHINEYGYHIWGKALIPLIEALMKRSSNEKE